MWRQQPQALPALQQKMYNNNHDDDDDDYVVTMAMALRRLTTMTLFILVSCSVHGRTAQLTADSLLCLLLLLLPPQFYRVFASALN